VFEDDGREQLAALGARSVPVVSRGSDFVYAQVIKDVVEFLGLNESTSPELQPAQLAARFQQVLATAIRLTRQMPSENLELELPNRPRSWRVLLHHVFQIPTAFLDAEQSGDRFEYENMVAPPPADMISSGAIAEFGDAVGIRFENWWQQHSDSDFEAPIDTYFGETSRHELLERTVWHTTQHVRQVASLLEQSGVTPDGPLQKADWDKLPLTDKIWD